MSTNRKKTSFLSRTTANLFFYGFNIEQSELYYAVRTKAIERVARGVYVRASLPANEKREVIRRNVCRIASYLYPDAVLAGPSAYHFGPVAGVLTLWQGAIPGGTTVGGINIEFARHEVPLGVRHDLVSVVDDFGEIKMRAMCKEMLILQDFSDWDQTGKKLSARDLEEVCRKAIIEAGSNDAFRARLARLAGAMPRRKAYLERANAYIDKLDGYEETKKYLKELNVYWHRRHIGTLAHDGSFWFFDYQPDCNLSLTLCDKVRKREVPPFVGSILPERRGEAKTKIGAGYDEFEIAERYMSNITVRPRIREGGKIIIDTLEGSLSDFTQQGAVFCGEIGPDLRAAFELRDEGVSTLDRDVRSARISGMQQKFGANLSVDGVLSSSIDKSFTHIIKPPLYLDERSSMGSMEWFCMALGSLAGLRTERFAIADMNWHAPVFIAERFDIRTDLNDSSFILAEEFLSIFGRHDTNDKTVGDMIDVAKVVMKLSTDAPADAEQLMRQTVYSWIIGNCDMHLKNLLMLKKANPSMTHFESIRLSPAYDLLCTNPYQSAKLPVLSIGASKEYDVAAFRALGKHLGMSAIESDQLVGSVVAKTIVGLDRLYGVLPPVIRNHRQSLLHIQEAATLIVNRCKALKADLDSHAPRSPGTKPADSATFSG